MGALLIEGKCERHRLLKVLMHGDGAMGAVSACLMWRSGHTKIQHCSAKQWAYIGLHETDDPHRLYFGAER